VSAPLAVVLTAILLVTACAVPQPKDTSLVSKQAATPASAAVVVARYNALRARADDSLDGSLLAEIEGGELLDIDQGAYFVSVRVDEPAGYPTVRLARPELVISPRFDAYPLWFVVMARDEQGGNKRVAVFEKQDSVSPWLMTIAPATTADAGLPGIAQDSTGAAVTVGPDDGGATGVTPAGVLQRYAGALAPGAGPDDAVFASDAFRTRNRMFQQTQASLPFATFQQTWSALPPRFALRLESGGFVVFGTVLRRDAYSVQPDSYIDWDDDADTAAYLPGRVYRSATLDYSHQLLLFVPPRGQGKPRLIGQHGGVVDGQGF
jgi:hypothetical protein